MGDLRTLHYQSNSDISLIQKTEKYTNKFLANTGYKYRGNITLIEFN